MKPETKFQNRVKKKKKKLDNLWVLKTQEKTRKGVPDLLICANGKFVAIELKAYKKNPDPLQQFELNCIAASGGVALVAYPENWIEIYKKIAMLSQC